MPRFPGQAGPRFTKPMPSDVHKPSAAANEKRAEAVKEALAGVTEEENSEESQDNPKPEESDDNDESATPQSSRARAKRGRGKPHSPARGEKTP